MREQGMASLEVVIRYEGDGADEGHLDLYDAGESLSGIATTINLITHAFANNNQVRERIPKPMNVQTFIGAARKGCFEKVIDIQFSEVVKGKVGNSVINKHFWEYLTH
jgi:hypothetical protein